MEWKEYFYNIFSWKGGKRMTDILGAIEFLITCDFSVIKWELQLTILATGVRFLRKKLNSTFTAELAIQIF